LTLGAYFDELIVLSTLSHLTEESLWASSLAARLRLVQANFADDPAATRQGYLHEEIERAIKDVNPGKRRAFLEALQQRFPVWQSSEPAPAPAAPASGIDTPEAALDKLLEFSPQLPPEVRAAMSRKLQASGFAITQAGGGGLPELPPEVLRKMGLAAGQQPNPERVVKLLTGLAEMVLALDQLVWTLWKQLAPKANVRKDGDFSKLIGPYLAGDAETSTPVVAAPLDKTRKLIAAMLGAIGRAGPAFAKKHVSQFSPEAIEDLAKLEKKWNESLEFAAWRKYRELYKERSTEATLEIELQEAIAKSAEILMGRGAS
jgi:hypothetical protein